MSEENFVFHCAPTLAGIKCGSLFTSPCSSRAQAEDSIRRLNRRLVGKGLRVIPLRYLEGKVLVYVYRPAGLERELQGELARSILAREGYTPAGADGAVMQLLRRFQSGGEFPHEIGLFLGYPAEDVLGFMENLGKNCKMVGTWKVYGDVEKARSRFEAYRSCTGELCRRLRVGGDSLEQLAVAM